MGEARRKRASVAPTVYHHTSTLRTNLIWMSGVIEVEGKSEGVRHPHLGEIKTDALARRGMKDFPPVAWFTTRIDPPECLIQASYFTFDKDTGQKKIVEIDSNMSNAIALNRIALGFPVADIPVVPWPEHYGYKTGEGQELNETAREVGDNPDDWYVAEGPVDVLKASEFWLAKNILKPNLIRFDRQLDDIRDMVLLCRTNKGVYIPPSWIKPEQAAALASGLNVPILDFKKPEGPP